MKEFAGSPLDGECTIIKIQNKEKIMDGQKTDEKFCGPIVVNEIKVEEQVVHEGPYKETDTVNEIKLERSDHVPRTGKTRGCLTEMNNGGDIANNMEERNTEEVIVKDNKTVICGLDIKYTNIGEERNSLEVATDNMVDGCLADSEFEITGKDPTDNQKTEREAYKLHTEVPMGTNLGNETAIYGLHITVRNIMEQRMSLDVARDMVDDGLAVSALQVTGNYLIDNSQNEKEANQLKTEVPMDTNLNIEAIVCGMDFKGADAREERKSLEIATDNMVNHALPASEFPSTGKNLMGSLLNEGENDKLNLEVAMGTKLDTETILDGVDIEGADARKERNSLEMATDNMGDRALPDPELQLTGKSLTNSLENEKEAKRLNSEVAMDTKSDDESVINGVGVNDANTQEDWKSSNVTTNSIADEGSAASELQIEGKNLIYDPHIEKEANKLKTEVSICTTLENGKIESGSVDPSVANNLKASPNNDNKPKRRRLNRKMFEKTVLGNNEATMNETKPPSSTGNDACIELDGADTNKHVKKDDKTEAKPLIITCRKINRLRRKQIPQGYAGTTTANDEQKSHCTNDGPENKVHKEIDELDMKNEEAEMFKKKKEEKVEPERARKMAVERRKYSKRVDIAGMIFMCSSETKEDCYNYRVLGLPACKRDIVSKIYKGMRLFMFHVELKMMYGIYKAAGPGGYNIEPRAFRSQFPSQVRFTVVQDCVPLIEENFRNAIRDNYYTKHKFNFQLTSEQVKNLCMLFHDISKRAEPKLATRIGITATPSRIQHDTKRKRMEDNTKPSPISALKLESEGQHETTFDIKYMRASCSRKSARLTSYEPLSPQDTRHIPSYSYGGAMTMDNMDINPYDSYERAYEISSVIHAYQEPTYETGVSHGYLEPEYENGAARAYREPAYETGTVSDAFQKPEYVTAVTHGYREQAYETGVSHAFSGPECEACVSCALREPTYETDVSRFAFRAPTYGIGASHPSREPTYKSGVSHAFREPTYETGVSQIHPLQEQTYTTGATTADPHTYEKPGYEIMRDSNQEHYGYTSSERQQVEYYRHGEYHDCPPRPPHRRY